jgi:osmotically-inducible protein OsmY
MNARMNWVAQRVAVAGAVLALAMAPAAQAQGADDLYEVTVRMEMVGMPMQMPAMTQRSCVKKGASDADAVPHQDNCTVTNARRDGNKVTFSMACTGRDAMTGNGEMTYAGDGYAGTIRLKGKMEGQDMEMTQAITGRRVGACTAR